MKHYKAIFAQDLDGNIGKDNHLPWKNSNDMNFFKKTTLNNIVIMGFKTFEGLGKKPLPNRMNVVLTHKVDFYENDENLIFLSNKSEVDDFVNAFSDEMNCDIFVIGGKSIFELFKDDFDTIFRTTILNHFDGDVKMDIDFIDSSFYPFKTIFFEKDDLNDEIKIEEFRKK